MSDPVNHPDHYRSHPSGVECIQITEHMNFCLGNAIKYIWRCGDKGRPLEDLRKARWYLDREIARRERIEINRQHMQERKYLDRLNEGEIADLYRDRLGEIREVWAGAEVGQPVTAQEAYAIALCKQMYRLACEALNRGE